MTQIATELRVAAKQVRVIDLLLAGEGVSAAAKGAGISRGTIYRWMKEDSAFIVEYNRRRVELIDQAQARLLGLAVKSVEAVELAISNGDVRVALQVLRGIGLLAGSRPPVGPTDEGEVALNQLFAQELRRMEQLLRPDEP